MTDNNTPHEATHSGTVTPDDEPEGDLPVLAERWELNGPTETLRVIGEGIAMELPLNDEVIDAVNSVTAPDRYDDRYDDPDEPLDDEEDLTWGESMRRVSGWTATTRLWDNLNAQYRTLIIVALVAFVVIIIGYQMIIS